MRAEEIFKHKPYLDKFDIMNIYNCGQSKATAIIRAIKYYSNTFDFSGRVSEKDYYIWARVPGKEE